MTRLQNDLPTYVDFAPSNTVTVHTQGRTMGVGAPETHRNATWGGMNG